MSEQATDLIERIEQAPVSVQREVATVVLERQFGCRGATTAPKPRIAEIAARYRAQPDAATGDRTQRYVEAIQASKALALTEIDPPLLTESEPVDFTAIALL